VDSRREIVMGLEGIIIVWTMEDEISEHSTIFFWDHFARKMPASNITVQNIMGSRG
jgi:hypothetical protein